MPFECNFYGLNRFILLDSDNIYELEELLQINLVFEENNATRRNGSYSCYIKNDQFELHFYGNIHDQRMIVSCCNSDLSLNQQLWNQFSQWLKDETGVILWPVTFDNSDMFHILDNLIPGKSASQFYSVKIMFESQRKDSLLDRYSIEISSSSCLNLWNKFQENQNHNRSNDDNINKCRLFCKLIVEYIENISGFYIMKLPIKQILLRNFMTITNRVIILVNEDDSLDIMNKILPFIYSHNILS